jgi:hypothetical protein
MAKPKQKSASKKSSNVKAPASPFGAVEQTYPTTIEEIVAAGEGGTYAMKEVYETLVQLKLAEINPAVRDSNGAVAIRATAKGIEYVNAQRNDAALSAAQPVEPEMEDDSELEDDVESEDESADMSDSDDEDGEDAFELESGIQIPELGPRVGFGRKSTYPFAKMNVGQSFFVPGVAKNSKKFKGLASTVSAAQRRFAREIPGKVRVNRNGEQVQDYELTRKFVLRAVDGGARVWRTA